MHSVRRVLAALPLLMVSSWAVALPTATPAFAAPGGAYARGLVLDLHAEVLGVVVVDAQAAIGTGTAPVAGGSGETNLEPFDFVGVGVTATGVVLAARADRGHASSGATARLNLAPIRILDSTVLEIGSAGSTVSCPLTGAAMVSPPADRAVALFGKPVALVPNGPAVVGGGSVTVPGVTAARLAVRLIRTETVEPGRAIAVGLTAFLTLTGTVAGRPATIPMGTIRIGEVECEAPRPPAVTSVVPAAGPRSGGQPVTVTGSGFIRLSGETSVRFNGRIATDVVVAADGASLTAVTPPGVLGTATVEVLVREVKSAPVQAYEFRHDGSDAEVGAVTPTSGPSAGGTRVTISGSGLTGVTGVTFAGVRGTGLVVAADGTGLAVLSPAGPVGPVDVVVLAEGGGGRVADGFTYLPAPERGSGGGLPLTGGPMAVGLLAGSAMIALGAVALLLLRRRTARPGL